MTMCHDDDNGDVVDEWHDGDEWLLSCDERTSYQSLSSM